MDMAKVHLTKVVSIKLAEALFTRENFMPLTTLGTEENREALAECIADFAERLCLAADRHKLKVEKVGNVEHKPETITVDDLEG